MEASEPLLQSPWLISQTHTSTWYKMFLKLSRGPVTSQILLGKYEELGGSLRRQNDKDPRQGLTKSEVRDLPCRHWDWSPPTQPSLHGKVLQEDPCDKNTRKPWGNAPCWGYQHEHCLHCFKTLCSITEFPRCLCSLPAVAHSTEFPQSCPGALWPPYLRHAGVVFSSSLPLWRHSKHSGSAVTTVVPHSLWPGLVLMTWKLRLDLGTLLAYCLFSWSCSVCYLMMHRIY